MQTPHTDRTKTLKIKVNPHLLERYESNLQKKGISIEDDINNYIIKKTPAKRLTAKQVKEIFSHPDTIAAVEELEAMKNDPNAKYYTCAADLIADCLKGDDDDED